MWELSSRPIRGGGPPPAPVAHAPCRAATVTLLTARKPPRRPPPRRRARLARQQEGSRSDSRSRDLTRARTNERKRLPVAAPPNRRPKVTEADQLSRRSQRRQPGHPLCPHRPLLRPQHWPVLGVGRGKVDAGEVVPPLGPREESAVGWPLSHCRFRARPPPKPRHITSPPTVRAASLPACIGNSDRPLQGKAGARHLQVPARCRARLADCGRWSAGRARPKPGLHLVQIAWWPSLRHIGSKSGDQEPQSIGAVRLKSGVTVATFITLPCPRDRVARLLVRWRRPVRPPSLPHLRSLLQLCCSRCRQTGWSRLLSNDTCASLAGRAVQSARCLAFPGQNHLGSR